LPILHQKNNSRPLISRSQDGEIIARICYSFGINPIRGSTSRGGASAILQLMDALNHGSRVGLSPDGPRGPFQEVHLGILYLAQKTGAAIVPMAFGAKRTWVFGSWDRFVVPQPFNRIAIAYGDALYVGPNDVLGEKAAKLKSLLDQVTAAADAAAR